MFPYFTWQQNLYLDYEGKATLQSDEENYWDLAYQKINQMQHSDKEATISVLAATRENIIYPDGEGRSLLSACILLSDARESLYQTLCTVNCRDYACRSYQNHRKVEDKDYTVRACLPFISRLSPTSHQQSSCSTV